MLASRRISVKRLAELCHRLSMSLGAGIDVRTAWAQEAKRASNSAARTAYELVAAGIRRGQTSAAALAEAGDFFPPLFIELAGVGEQTGHLPEVFAQLSDHYALQVKLRRDFISTISWPMAQLLLAVAIVGFLIWVMGIIGPKDGTHIDIIGLGLTGDRGLMIYLALVAAVAGVIVVTALGVRRGLRWAGPLQRLVCRTPGLGTALTTLALARLAWSMQITLNTGMDVRRAIRLSLQSTRHPRFLDAIDPADAVLAAHESIYEALAQTAAFPGEFLDSVHVGEQTGNLVEAMAHLAKEYRARAEIALAFLTAVAGRIVKGIVAIFIIVIIFRIFGWYMGILNNAIKGQ